MRLSGIEKAVLATVVYFYVCGVSLELRTLVRRLLNPRRFSKHIGKKITELSVIAAVRVLVRRGLLEEISFGTTSFIVLAGHSTLVGLYRAREKITTEKMRKLIALRRWFVVVPFVRCVFASGSLVLKNSDENSDLDVVILTAPRRIWMVRLLLSLLLSLRGVRRTKFESEAPDKVCLSHYLVTDTVFDYQSIFTAQILITLRPLWEAWPGTAGHFFRSQNWVKDFFVWYPPEFPDPVFHGRSWWQRIGEWVLCGKLGDAFEYVARWFQIRRIKKDVIRRAINGRIVATDAMLEFHPDSKEIHIIERYNEHMKKLGLPELGQEKVSKFEVVVG